MKRILRDMLLMVLRFFTFIIVLIVGAYIELRKLIRGHY